MKSMFQCERCGKLSEEYDVIRECERSHYIIDRGWCSIDGLQEQLDKMTEYKEGQEEPNVLHIAMAHDVFDKDECSWKTEYRVGKYKLVSSYAAPLVIEND